MLFVTNHALECQNVSKVYLDVYIMDGWYVRSSAGGWKQSFVS